VPWRFDWTVLIPTVCDGDVPVVDRLLFPDWTCKVQEQAFLSEGSTLFRNPSTFAVVLCE
jgi:hypothetical protein